MFSLFGMQREYPNCNVYTLSATSAWDMFLWLLAPAVLGLFILCKKLFFLELTLYIDIDFSLQMYPDILDSRNDNYRTFTYLLVTTYPSLGPRCGFVFVQHQRQNVKRSDPISVMATYYEFYVVSPKC